MAEWDFAQLLEFLADTHNIGFTQLIGKKPINCVKPDSYRFGFGIACQRNEAVIGNALRQVGTPPLRAFLMR
jgi:hypothetical protein